MKDCNNCERRLKAENKRLWCIAFTYKPKKCWAWTDDKDWLKKVNNAVAEYSKCRS